MIPQVVRKIENLKNFISKMNLKTTITVDGNVNKNTIPGEKRSPFITSGIRIGTPAITTRKFNQTTSIELANYICDVLDDVTNAKVIQQTKAKVLQLSKRFPIYIDDQTS